MSKKISDLFNILDEYTESIIIKELGKMVAPINIETIIQNYGIQIFKRSISSNESGAIVIKDNESGMIINQNEPINRQRFTMAHELGHFISYRLQGKTGEIIEFRNGTSSLGTNIEEIFANKFAASILMPKTLIINMLNVTDDIVKLAFAFGVSKKAMENRFKNLLA